MYPKTLSESLEARKMAIDTILGRDGVARAGQWSRG